MKIVVTARGFDKNDEGPLRLLREHFSEVVLNPTNRKPSEDESIEWLRGAAGVLAGTEKLTEKVMAACPSLRVISRLGVGLDSVDLEAARRRNIQVLTTPGGLLADAVAELALGLMLGCLRHIARADRAVRANAWAPFMGNLLRGKTVGIIGLGRIGRRTAELLAPFHVTLLGYDIAPPPASDIPAIRITALDALAAESNFISLHVPLSPETRHLLAAPHFERMKAGAIIINTSRGGTVDENALLQALESGTVAAAGLDVFEKEPYTGPLRDFEQVILTTHIGSYATEARIDMEWAAARNLIKALTGGDSTTNPEP